MQPLLGTKVFFGGQSRSSIATHFDLRPFFSYFLMVDGAYYNFDIENKPLIIESKFEEVTFGDLFHL